MKRFSLALLVIAALAAAGCGQKVTRVDVEETIDLSGRWNDTDSRLVSEEMIKDCLSRPWLEDFSRTQGKRPVVIVGTIRNRSHEHISTETFTKDLERALINSGQVDFVASRDQREEIRDERKDQAEYSSEETAKAFGREIGADYMLQGSINTILDKLEDTAVMYYQVDLELINLESNRKAWIGDKKIKKLIERSRVKF